MAAAEASQSVCHQVLSPIIRCDEAARSAVDSGLRARRYFLQTVLFLPVAGFDKLCVWWQRTENPASTGSAKRTSAMAAGATTPNPCSARLARDIFRSAQSACRKRWPRCGHRRRPAARRPPESSASEHNLASFDSGGAPPAKLSRARSKRFSRFISNN